MLVTKAEILVILGKTTSLTAADEALIDMLHPWVEAVVRNYLQQQLDYQQHVEYLPIGQVVVEHGSLQSAAVDFTGSRVSIRAGSAGTETLQLRHTPVSPLDLEVREDPGGRGGQAAGAFGDDTILTVGTDYYLDLDKPGISSTGLLYRAGCWPTEPRSVKVTYYGGYTAAQLNGAAGDIKLVTLRTFRKVFKQEKNAQTGDGPKLSETIGKYSYSTSDAAANAMAGAGYTISPEDQVLLQPHRNYGRIFG